MLKISAAIFAHPEDLKYQRLKFSNRLVSEKINARTGGKEYMLAMGFNVEIDDGDKKEGDSGGVGGAVGGEKVYVLRPDGLDGLAASVDWLRCVVLSSSSHLTPARMCIVSVCCITCPWCGVSL